LRLAASMIGIVESEACVRRGLYSRASVDKLLADLQTHFTPIQGTKLWHPELLEWWLQAHVDAGTNSARASPVRNAIGRRS
jgi:asparagine synthase (glutamine-hydrolysing)